MPDLTDRSDPGDRHRLLASLRVIVRPWEEMICKLAIHFTAPPATGFGRNGPASRVSTHLDEKEHVSPLVDLHENRCFRLTF